MPFIEGIQRSDETTVRMGKNGILVREDQYDFTVIADDIYQEKAQILLTPGLPVWGAIYIDTGLSLRSQSAARHPDDPLRWNVRCGLSTEVEDSPSRDPDGTGGTGNPDPTTWRPIGSVRFETYQETITHAKDLSGNKVPVRNSARDFFTTGAERTRRIACVQFSQFEPITTTLDELMERSDSINETEYKGKEEATLLLSIENSTIGTFNGFRCWRVDYTMRYKPDNWYWKPLDHGSFFYDAAGKRQAFFSKQWESGTYVPGGDKEDVFDGLLDGTGKALPNQLTGTPQYLTFILNPKLEFNDFLRIVFLTA